MFQSMTGFVSYLFVIDNINFNIVIKTTNHKFFEAKIKIPLFLNNEEHKIKDILKNKIKRGYIDFSIKETNTLKSISNKINEPVLENYIRIINKIKKNHTNLSYPSITDLISLPDVYENNYKVTNLSSFYKHLNTLVNKLILMQSKEGSFLKIEINKYLNEINKNIKLIKEKNKNILKDNIKKYKNILKELLDSNKIDENRILIEAGIISTKLDIAEELCRLNSHIKQFKEFIKKEEIIKGRTLDFIIQEMHREINTIGSKTYTCTKEIVVLKTLLEKIKEQVQNVK